MTKYFGTKELLKPPTARAAFSDRQAYVCAEMSKLAYFKFEGGHSLDDALELIRSLLGDSEKFDQLREQLSTVLGHEPSGAEEGEAALRKILTEVGFHLEEVFSEEGTQAFLCTRHRAQGSLEKTVAFLAFRGTEPRSFVDIKTDVKADLIEVELGEDKVSFHQGYWDAFCVVRQQIENALEKISTDQLFITGHSLGGALAVVTTRVLASDSTGACYTFGAPPVGSVTVQNMLKTPVYQIINEIDIVPRLPSPWLAAAGLFLLWLVKWLGKFISALGAVLRNSTWDEALEKRLSGLGKFRHPGYVSYLVGQGKHARLRYSVSSFDRAGWWLRVLTKSLFGGFKKMLSDHSIDTYIEKISAHALNRRSQKKVPPASKKSDTADE